jgi:hypothetical protein
VRCAAVRLTEAAQSTDAAQSCGWVFALSLPRFLLYDILLLLLAAGDITTVLAVG